MIVTLLLERRIENAVTAFSIGLIALSLQNMQVLWSAFICDKFSEDIRKNNL